MAGSLLGAQQASVPVSADPTLREVIKSLEATSAVELSLERIAEAGFDAVAAVDRCLVTTVQDHTLMASCGSESRSTSWPPRTSEDAAAVLTEAVRLVDPEQVVRAARVKMVARALARAVNDPYTAYLAPEFVASVATQRTSMFAASTGFDVWPRDPTRVRTVRRSSDAADRGVAVGDQIVSIDGTAADGLTFAEVTSLLYGAAGTTVRLRVRRDAHEWTVELTRELLSEHDIVVESLKNRVVYVSLPAFTEGSAAKVASILADRRPAAVVLDLRRNGGGYLPEGVAVADLFLSAGPIAGVRTRAGRPTEDFVAHDSPNDIRAPLVVLVDEHSASASELVAMALKDRGRAFVMGARTAGKGTVQRQIHMPDGGILKVTAGYYVGPSGRPLKDTGLVPDRLLTLGAALTVHEGARVMADPWVLAAVDVVQGIAFGSKARPPKSAPRTGPAP